MKVTSRIKTFLGSKTSASYGQTKKDYYQSRVFLRNLDQLSNIFEPTSLADEHTSVPIKFFGIDFGSSIKETVKKLGRPNFKTTEIRLFNDHQIVFYRLKISGIGSIIQLHFIQNQFFLGVTEMRTNSNKEKETIFDLMKEKFKVENSVIGKFIEDQNGNQLNMINDVVPYAVYTSADPALRKALFLSSKKPISEIKSKHHAKAYASLDTISH